MEAAGGGAKSLNVVKESHWLAEVCIWSRAEASCSLSMVALVVIEASEPRRPLRLMGEEIFKERGEPVGFWGLLWLDIVHCRACIVGVTRKHASNKQRDKEVAFGIQVRESGTRRFSVC